MLAPDLFLEGPLFIEQKVAYGCAGHGYDEGEGIAYAVILNESVQDAKLHQRSKCAKAGKEAILGQRSLQFKVPVLKRPQLIEDKVRSNREHYAKYRRM